MSCASGPVYATRRAWLVLKALLRLPDGGTWVVGRSVLGCAYPRTDAALVALTGRGVSVLVNLHERPHDPARLRRHRLSEIHLPVRDFTAPSTEILEEGVAAIGREVDAGRRVAVHCGGGLGRTGTLLACYLVHEGMGPEAAVEEVRLARPGSVETRAQEEAVMRYAERPRRCGDEGTRPPGEKGAGG